VLKESAEHELIAAIRAVAAGKPFFSPKVRRVPLAEHAERLRREGRDDSYELLTETRTGALTDDRGREPQQRNRRTEHPDRGDASEADCGEARAAWDRGLDSVRSA
jgi:hypothetical protein